MNAKEHEYQVLEAKGVEGVSIFTYLSVDWILCFALLPNMWG